MFLRGFCFTWPSFIRGPHMSKSNRGRLHRTSPQQRVRHGSIPSLRPRPLLTPGELRFFGVLLRVIAERCDISLKVRLADLVLCPDRLWCQPLGRRLAQKHVDFVLFVPSTGVILAAIELDDKSHDSPLRRRRDGFVNRLLERSGIPLIRVRCAPRYFAEDLERMLLRRVPSISDRPATRPAAVEGIPSH